MSTSTDRFEKFEQMYPELVAVDSSGYTMNKLDFVAREREEMRVLTEATEVLENIWVSPIPCVGNLQNADMYKFSSLEIREMFRMHLLLEVPPNLSPLFRITPTTNMITLEALQSVSKRLIRPSCPAKKT